MEYYKIVRVEKGKVKALFHGRKPTEGEKRTSREFPKGKWIEAVKKPVIDGSGGTVYTSGFHVLSTYESCLEYLKHFRGSLDDKAIVKCEVGGDIWLKTHSRHEKVYLVDKIKVIDVYPIKELEYGL